MCQYRHVMVSHRAIVHLYKGAAHVEYAPMFGWFRFLLWGVVVATGLGLAASFAGGLHPAGDALAVFRIQLGLVCAFFALLLHIFGSMRALAVVLASLAGIAPALWAYVGPVQMPQDTTTLYQKNLSFRLGDPAPLLADIRAADPDIVTLQELGGVNMAVLDGLAADLPTRLVCPFNRIGAVALATRWPARAGTEICETAWGLAGLQVEHPDGPLWIVSVHLHWPWPYRQPQQMHHILPTLRRLDGPVLMAGDFNMVPWSHTLRQLARATNTRRVGPALDSFPRFGAALPMPIDHVFAPAGKARATLRPLLGSDHHGLLVKADW